MRTENYEVMEFLHNSLKECKILDLRVWVSGSTGKIGISNKGINIGITDVDVLYRVRKEICEYCVSLDDKSDLVNESNERLIASAQNLILRITDMIYEVFSSSI